MMGLLPTPPALPILGGYDASPQHEAGTEGRRMQLMGLALGIPQQHHGQSYPAVDLRKGISGPLGTRPCNSLECDIPAKP
jgi:hypothetical protein